jgi:hypothetical protein
MDAKFPGFIGAGRNHPPAIGRASHDYTLSLQRGILSNLNRGKIGVHIDVDDLSHSEIHLPKSEISVKYMSDFPAFKVRQKMGMVLWPWIFI